MALRENGRDGIGTTGVPLASPRRAGPADPRARMRPHHVEEIKCKIKVVQLISMLDTVARTGLDAAGHEVSPVRVDCAKFLISRVIPAAQLNTLESIHYDGNRLLELANRLISLNNNKEKIIECNVIENTDLSENMVFAASTLNQK